VKIISNVRVGKPDTTPDVSAHTRGVKEGNRPGNIKHEAGIKVLHTDMAVGTAHRSTGINAEARNPIDPRMPNLSPA